MKKGFTVIEILIVISVMLILATLLTPVINQSREEALKKKAQSMIYSLSLAIKTYEADGGFYPENAQLVTRLMTSGPNAPYINLKPNEINGANVVDPWGNDYVYVNPGVKPGNTGFVDIYSFGPDKVNNNGAAGSDDIKNW